MPIALLLQLAGAIPTLAKYLGAPDAAQSVANKVGEIAQTITGAASPEEAVKQLFAEKELMAKMQQAVMENETKLDAMFLADVQSARNRDVEIRKTGQRNWRAETMYVLAVVVVIGVFYAIWTTPDINESVKAIATLVLGRFLGYLDSIYNFEFGTTRTSRDKDETIKQLSKDS